MPSDLYWIDAGLSQKLAISARPRAADWLEDEVAHWRSSGVEIVVSLLEAEEVHDLGLEQEAALCRGNGLEFRSFPIPDRGLPGDDDAAMRFASELAHSGKAIVIHCLAGIGRSSLLAAAVLICGGVSADTALLSIEAARGLRIPDTEEQRAWIVARERS